MSPVRWMTTCLAMAGAAWLLTALGPDPEQVRRAVTSPQALVDAAGPDALLVVAAGVAGWLCWAWGVLGLLLTGLSALPGAAGQTAGLLLVLVLPAGARRVAAIAVGLSLVAAGPVAIGASPPTAVAPALVETAAATDAPGALEADWPGAQPVPHATGAAVGGGARGAAPTGHHPRRRTGRARRRARAPRTRGRRTWSSAATACGTSPPTGWPGSGPVCRSPTPTSPSRCTPGGWPTPPSSAPTPTCCCPARCSSHRADPAGPPPAPIRAPLEDRP
jgi:hypothetical protein